MSKEKPSAPRGMRDFGPTEMARRQYIFGILKDVFEKYGFSPIETPAMEKLETLTGKYGTEGDRLIFKVLNSGDYLADVRQKHSSIADLQLSSMLPMICEKALRYDLTVPFARYVVQYHHEIAFPFKRYQIQPVWRADNPQKGRYREFCQCDVDVVGSASLLNEVELVHIIREGLTAMKIPAFTIKLNNRKILSGAAEVIGIADRFNSFTVALDKLDKVGPEKVLESLSAMQLSETQTSVVSKLLNTSGSNEQRLQFLSELLSSSETGMKGIEEIRYVLAKSGSGAGEIVVDYTLARGLDYYTGCIFEVVVPGSGMGSIIGGGRYDDLTGIFGVPGLSGVGISFGADRIYDLLLAQALFPELAGNRYRFFFLNFGEAEADRSFDLVQQLRSKGFRTGIYPDPVKIKKQMSYADHIGAEIVCTIGQDELRDNTIGVKNMQSGEQTTMSLTDFIREYLS